MTTVHLGKDADKILRAKRQLNVLVGSQPHEAEAATSPSKTKVVISKRGSSAESLASLDALIDYCTFGNISKAHEIIPEVEDVNAYGSSGLTPLNAAVSQKLWDITLFLLKMPDIRLDVDDYFGVCGLEKVILASPTVAELLRFQEFLVPKIKRDFARARDRLRTLTVATANKSSGSMLSLLIHILQPDTADSAEILDACCESSQSECFEEVLKSGVPATRDHWEKAARKSSPSWLIALLRTCLPVRTERAGWKLLMKEPRFITDTNGVSTGLLAALKCSMR